MDGYNESTLIDIKAIKGECFCNTILTKAIKVSLITKKISN